MSLLDDVEVEKQDFNISVDIGLMFATHFEIRPQSLVPVTVRPLQVDLYGLLQQFCIFREQRRKEQTTNSSLPFAALECSLIRRNTA